MHRFLAVALVAVLACGGDPQPAPAPPPQPAPQPAPQPQPPAPAPPAPQPQPPAPQPTPQPQPQPPAPAPQPPPTPPAPPATPASLDVLLGHRGPTIENVSALNMTSIVAVVVYFDDQAPPASPGSAASNPAQGSVPVSDLDACDVGGGVWKAIPPLGILLPFNGDDAAVGIAHLSDVPDASRIEVHVIVDYLSLRLKVGTNEFMPAVAVGACQKDGHRYQTVRAGPVPMETRDGKNTRAEVVIESRYFAAHEHGTYSLDWAALEEQP